MCKTCLCYITHLIVFIGRLFWNRMFLNKIKYRVFCKYTALASLTGTFVFLVLSKVMKTEMYIIRWNMTEDISCHFIDTNDALPLLDKSYSPPEKSIFFHETSCRGGLSARQACAVESAAKAHPHWTIHMFFSGPVTKAILTKSCLSKLLEYSNVKLFRIHIAEYALGSPLETIAARTPYNRSKWRIEHASDLLRYLTLYKYAGVYLDTDVLVVKPLDSLAKNFAARETDKAVDAGVLSFSGDDLGRKIANATIEDFRNNYLPGVWGNNGPGVITRVIKNMCRKKKGKGKGKKWYLGCNGFMIYEPALFYPVYYKQYMLYVTVGATLPNETVTYIHHFWNAFTRNLTIPKNSPYDRLAKKHCPNIYELYGDHFGDSG